MGSYNHLWLRAQFMVNLKKKNPVNICLLHLKQTVRNKSQYHIFSVEFHIFNYRLNLNFFNFVVKSAKQRDGSQIKLFHLIPWFNLY